MDYIEIIYDNNVIGKIANLSYDDWDQIAEKMQKILKSSFPGKYWIYDTGKFQNKKIPVYELDKSKLNSGRNPDYYTIGELKELNRTMGLGVGGNKSELLQRIRNYMIVS